MRYPPFPRHNLPACCQLMCILDEFAVSDIALCMKGARPQNSLLATATFFPATEEFLCRDAQPAPRETATTQVTNSPLRQMEGSGFSELSASDVSYRRRLCSWLDSVAHLEQNRRWEPLWTFVLNESRLTRLKIRRVIPEEHVWLEFLIFREDPT